MIAKPSGGLLGDYQVGSSKRDGFLNSPRDAKQVLRLGFPGEAVNPWERAARAESWAAKRIAIQNEHDRLASDVRDSDLTTCPMPTRHP